MSGTINLAFTQQFDMDGVPLSGGLLYFFTAGTTTPQSAFQDTGLTITHPNPMVLDASGRVPMFYLADGFIKIRLTDKNGVTVIAADQLLVIGPSTTSTGGGGGGGTPSDVTQLMQTGDIKARYSTIAIDGFVRLNGQSIGTTGSSASERADPTCQPLFVYLWPFSNITLDGFAKGASALADFTAGRRMFLPDLRGRTIAGLDNMGAAAANRLTGGGMGAGIPATVLGNVGGFENYILATADIPTHAHALSNTAGGNATLSNENALHQHAIPAMTSGGATPNTHTHSLPSSGLVKNTGGGLQALPTTGPYGIAGAIDTGVPSEDHTHTIPASTYATGTESAPHSHDLSGATQSNGGGGPHTNTQPTMVLTFYMKM